MVIKNTRVGTSPYDNSLDVDMSLNCNAEEANCLLKHSGRYIDMDTFDSCIEHSDALGCGENKKEANPHFSGYFKTVNGSIYIREVIYSKPATIIFWSDNTKTISKCQGEDKWSPEVGLTLCVMKKLVGSKQLMNMFSEWIPATKAGTNPVTQGKITLKEVRKNSKK